MNQPAGKYRKMSEITNQPPSVCAQWEASVEKGQIIIFPRRLGEMSMRMPKADGLRIAVRKTQEENLAFCRLLLLAFFCEVWADFLRVIGERNEKLRRRFVSAIEAYRQSA